LAFGSGAHYLLCDMAACYWELRMSDLAQLVARASQLLDESFHPELRRCGVSHTEWRVLAAFGERDGARMMDLAQRAMFKQPTLTSRGLEI
jgi:hypothetical protein